MRKVLFISAERLGDTLFLTPALAFAREHAPDVKIDVIAVTPLAAAVLSNNPSINRIFVQPTQAKLEEIADNYDDVLIPHISPEARQCAEKIHVKAIENPYIRELVPAAEKTIKFTADVLKVEWNGEPIPYQLFPQLKDEQYVKDLLAKKGVKQTDKIIAMHVGCHGLAKKHSSWFKKNRHEKVWPLKNFVKLSKKLLATYPNAKLIVTGSKAEEALANKFLKKIPQAVSLVNQTNVAQLAALFEKVDLFICSDTGALHVACAMKAWLIGLYGPTDTSQTGPYPPSNKFLVLKRGELAKLAVNNVYSAAQQFLSSE